LRLKHHVAVVSQILGSSVLQLQGDVSVNLSKEANVMPISVLQGVADINIKDNAQFMLSTNGGSAVVDLANKSEWIGSFSAFTGSIVINGDHHAEFITNSSPSGATEVSNGAPAHVIINADIGEVPKSTRPLVQPSKSEDRSLQVRFSKPTHFLVNSDLHSVHRESSK
jgi:hypothetical protein